MYRCCVFVAGLMDVCVSVSRCCVFVAGLMDVCVGVMV